MVTLKNCSLNISEFSPSFRFYCPVKEDENNYVKLLDGANYAVVIKNHWGSRRALATVYIDGEKVAFLSLRPNETVSLEESPYSEGKFTYVSRQNPKFYEHSLGRIKEENLGLVTVDFAPEKIQVPFTLGQSKDVGFLSSFTFNENVERSSGRTVLTGESTQEFVKGASFETDDLEQVILHLRLETRPPARPLPTTNGIPPAR